jgi:hypothetical protein
MGDQAREALLLVVGLGFELMTLHLQSRYSTA